MMLQGHTIDTVLSPIYRDSDSIIYQLWHYMRGMTAPLFLLVSGLLVGYLYRIYSYDKSKSSLFLKKILKRGLILLAVGYILRFNLGALYSFLDFSDPGFQYFISIHILHVIGVALLFSYLLLQFFSRVSSSKIYPISLTFVVLALLSFMMEFFIVGLDLSSVYLPIRNYLDKDNFSVFTLFPWIGYHLFGVCLGSLSLFKTNSPLFLLFGIVLIGFGYLSGEFEKIVYLSDYGWRYIWLGWAIVIVGFFKFLMQYKSLSVLNLISRLGRRTFSLYIIHEIILFGALTGYGIGKLYYHKLNFYDSTLLSIVVISLCITLNRFIIVLKNRVKKRTI